MAKKDQEIKVTVEIVRVKDFDVGPLLRAIKFIDELEAKEQQVKEGA